MWQSQIRLLDLHGREEWHHAEKSHSQRTY
jgi:hypothetical protein